MEGSTSATAPSAEKLYPFQEQLTAMLVQPKFCLAFVTADTLKHIDKVFSFSESTVTTKKKNLPKHHRPDWEQQMADEKIISGVKTIVDRLLNPFLPVQCDVHCIDSPGIIGCRDNLIPVEVEKGYAISGLLLPDIPGITVHHSLMELNVFVESDFQPAFPNVPTIKCLLMFKAASPFHGCLPRRGGESCDNIIEQCVAFNNNEFAVGGMYLERMWNLSNNNSLCVAFAGENLEAASIVVDKGTTDVAYVLAQFKKTGLLENQCFALMFSGMDKGICKYSVPNYESSIFRSLYPNVPLTRLIGNRAIGTHFLPNVGVDGGPEHKRTVERYPDNYSFETYSQHSNTVFVLQSVKTSK